MYPPISLPSPPTSAEENIFDSQRIEVSPIDPKPFPYTPAATRKRRLSDADAHVPPKRPRGLTVDPRVHVSDPLPMSDAVVQAQELQNWDINNFEFNFDPPSAVTSHQLDPSELLDVELFDNWTNGITLANNPPDPGTNCKMISIGYYYLLTTSISNYSYNTPTSVGPALIDRIHD
jgi:hypothetical protein